MKFFCSSRNKHEAQLVQRLEQMHLCRRSIVLASPKYILVLDVRYVKILDHKNAVQNNLNFSSDKSII
jgi:hypothetical protein